MIVDSHIPHDVVARFLQGEAPKEEERWVTRHLLSGCQRCHGLAQQLISHLSEGGRLLIQKESYSRTFQSLLANFLATERRRQRDVIAAPATWAKLKVMPPLRREMLIRAAPQSATWGLFDLLLSEAWVARLIDPKESIEIAGLALFLADYLQDVDFSESFRLSLKAEAYTALGNFYRIIEDFKAAAEHLDLAEECLEMGTGENILEGRMMSIRGSLLCDVGNLEEAIRCVRASIHLFREIEETELMAHGWIKLSSVLKHTNPMEGVQAAEYGLQNVEPANRQLFTFGHLSRIDCMVECGYGPAALAEFRKHQRLIQEIPGARHRANVKFLAARIAAAIGSQKEAVRLLVGVIQDYRNLELYQEMAIAQLRLVWLLIERRKWGRALQLCEQAITIFQRAGLRLDVLTVWLTVRELLAKRAFEEPVAKRAADMIVRYWKVGVPKSVTLSS